MKRKPELYRRFSACCLIFALLGLLFTGNAVQNSAQPSVHAQARLIGAPKAVVYAIPHVSTTEELLRAQTERCTQLRRQSGARAPFGFLTLGRYSVCAANMHAVLLPQTVCEQRGHRRFIIKYIHDQDGCKPAAFVFCNVYTSNETKVENYGSNCADRGLCCAVSRYDYH